MSDQQPGGSQAPRIEIFADIWCPFAHVGISTAFALRQQLKRGDVALVIRPWPLEYVNNAPMDPQKAYANAMALRAQVAPELFARVDPDDFPATTIPALALSVAAYDVSTELGESVSRALRQSLFEEGRNIASMSVLTEIAGAHGLDPSVTDNNDAVLAEWRAGQVAGVTGSPHFFAGASNVFCPVLDIARDVDGALNLQRNGAELERFLVDYLSQR